MEYQKRLRFIEYILENLIDLNDDRKNVVLFHYDDYEKFEKIEFFKTKSFDDAAEILHFLSCGEVGASLFFWTRNGNPVLRFCDDYLFYEFDLMLNHCYTSELMRIDLKDPRWDLYFITEIKEALSRIVVIKS
jgi:hypothetical protein